MKEMICIICPMGCHLKVDDSDVDNIKVSGNGCIRGVDYAKEEVMAPKRTVTSIVRVHGGKIKMVSVKTKDRIPKALIFPVLEQLKTITVDAPIYIGDEIIKNVCNTRINIIATKTVSKK